MSELDLLRAEVYCNLLDRYLPGPYSPESHTAAALEFVDLMTKAVMRNGAGIMFLGKGREVHRPYTDPNGD